ncbi:hypothetical protein BUALT_Bualt02G0212600 [Buddleja alternifolia]|uniref:Uncharacterized protein n=1 Tax=Buddleja alternifolia TaxID=168488 RepID=A0AAV6Y8W3_9LAMI|nr:hypothetical protein BUALT_Bualt02G0212600 [Buddleja alternifolia]
MEEEEEEGAMEFDMDTPLALILKRKRKAKPKKTKPHSPPDIPTESANNSEPARLSAAVEHLPSNAPPEITVSEFDYSVENHFKYVDTIAKLCGHSTTIDADQAEIKRLSNSITFLREWMYFNYAPRVVRFDCQHNSEENDVIDRVTLPQFSAASVPKKDTQDMSKTLAESSKDFVMHVGGAVWALDWCPRVDRNSENRIESEFVAVAAHPPESSYHKIGAPLTGRGAIQIWCLLTVCVKEDVPSQESKKSRQNSQKKGTVKTDKPTKPQRPRGRPRKKPLNDSVEEIDTDRQYAEPLAIEYPVGSSSFGRPRKEPLNDLVENIDTDRQYAQPLAVEYPAGSSRKRTSENTSVHVLSEGSGRTDNDSNQTEHSTLLLTPPKGRGYKAKARKQDQVDNNDSYILRQCEHRESLLVNSLESTSTLDSLSLDTNTCMTSCDANTSKYSIPEDVAVPRMMLCLAHNGKVAWDVKWRPVNACESESINKMGYLAVVLGNGAVEVWEVPLPHAVKLVFPASQERIDPRFIKLRPVFRCSMLKCGDKQSIPLTVEWSASSPHDMILAGCHDGVVALWKFSITDSSTETRPLLSFSSDTGPIRSLAWAPFQSDVESSNVIVTAGHKGLKFWDVRDPFRPLWDHPIPGVASLDWLPDPRCALGSIDDGTLWLLNLEKAAYDIPVTGKSLPGTTKHGFHSFDCSSFSIWSIQASRLTGMVAYCGEEGKTFCFQPTTRSVRDPSRNRLQHYLCGSLLEEESTLIVVTPLTNNQFQGRAPGMKRSGAVKDQAKRTKEQTAKGQTCTDQPLAICYGSDPVDEHGSNSSSTAINKEASKSKQSSKSQLNADQVTNKADKEEEIELFPPKIVAMHRVRWNINKGSEKWLCYGGAAGLLRCQEVDLSFPK